MRCAGTDTCVPPGSPSLAWRRRRPRRAGNVPSPGTTERLAAGAPGGTQQDIGLASRLLAARRRRRPPHPRWGCCLRPPPPPCPRRQPARRPRPRVAPSASRSNQRAMPVSSRKFKVSPARAARCCAQGAPQCWHARSGGSGAQHATMSVGASDSHNARLRFVSNKGPKPQINALRFRQPLQRGGSLPGCASAEHARHRFRTSTCAAESRRFTRETRVARRLAAVCGRCGAR